MTRAGHTMAGEPMMGKLGCQWDNAKTWEGAMVTRLGMEAGMQ